MIGVAPSMITDDNLTVRQLTELVRVMLSTPQYAGYEIKQIPDDEEDLRILFRNLMNVWHPQEMNQEFWDIQDAYLSAETQRSGVLKWQDLPDLPHELLAQVGSDRFKVWLGDICRLDVDAIVNAANSQMLGCFKPGHFCVDNAIHSSAGLQLRAECNELMQAQGHAEPTGSAKLTGAYNLPAKNVIHTVGPIVQGEVTQQHRDQLASSYRECLKAADEAGLTSIAFCAVSTGVFGFPQHNAAHIAVDTVRTYIKETDSPINVIFNVYNEQALQDYLHALEVPVTYEP